MSKIYCGIQVHYLYITFVYSDTTPIGRLSMARFLEAEQRLLNKKICMKCGASNAPKAIRCRRCRSKELRVKAKEGRGV